MNLIDLIIAGKLDEAKQCCCDRLKEITAKRLEEAKRYVVADMFEEVEEQLDERRNTNLVKMGRINRILQTLRC
jgi:hypothetical protein